MREAHGAKEFDSVGIAERCWSQKRPTSLNPTECLGHHMDSPPGSSTTQSAILRSFRRDDAAKATADMRTMRRMRILARDRRGAPTDKRCAREADRAGQA